MLLGIPAFVTKVRGLVARLGKLTGRQARLIALGSTIANQRTIQGEVIEFADVVLRLVTRAGQVIEAIESVQEFVANPSPSTGADVATSFFSFGVV
jgi:hypothetical protein